MLVNVLATDGQNTASRPPALAATTATQSKWTNALLGSGHTFKGKKSILGRARVVASSPYLAKVELKSEPQSKCVVLKMCHPLDDGDGRREKGRAGSPLACQKEETQCSGTMERSVRGADLLVVGESE